MKNHSAAAKAHGKQCGIEHLPDEMHSAQVHGFCFSASQRKAK
jgi:hypothetical protein